MDRPSHLPDVAPGETIVDRVDFWAKHIPDHNAGRWINASGKLEREITFLQLQRCAIQVAVVLRDQYGLKKGDRVLLCFEPSLDFNICILACFALGVVAVPVAPILPRRFEQMVKKLDIVAEDCKAVCYLCNSNYKRFIQLQKAASMLTFRKSDSKWMTIDWNAPDTFNEAPHPNFPTLASLATVTANDIAFLQYTSGSTGAPKGVTVTFANVTNQLALQVSVFGPPRVSATFLPHYHDMGLIGTILQPWSVGCGGFAMSPLTFLQNPKYFLQCVSKYRSTNTAFPNFALHLMATRVKDEDLQGIDLSCASCFILGAEPIRPSVVAAFAKRFKKFKLNPGCLCPAYGLAEHVLAVTLRPPGENTLPLHVKANREALYQQHRFVPAEEGEDGVELSESGRLNDIVDLRIVDPATNMQVEDGLVGEVWIQSNSVTDGYWHNEEATNKTFKARLADKSVDKNFLRTGDLAFLLNGVLYITGRMKDVIIVNGANVYPQDIEAIVEDAHPLMRKGCSVAFAVPSKDGLTESYSIVAEVKIEDKTDERLTEIATTCAVAVNHVFGSFPIELVLVPKHGIVKTSSGKVARQPTKRAHEANQLKTLFVWDQRLMMFLPRPRAESNADEQRPAARAMEDVVRHNRRRSMPDDSDIPNQVDEPHNYPLKRSFSAHNVSEEQSSTVRRMRKERYEDHEPASVNTRRSLKTLQDQVARILCRHIDGDVTPRDIDIHTHYSCYGLSSVASMQVLGEINSMFDANLEPQDMFTHPTIAELALLLQPIDEGHLVDDLQMELYDEVSDSMTTGDPYSRVPSEIDSEEDSSEQSPPEEGMGSPPRVRSPLGRSSETLSPPTARTSGLSPRRRGRSSRPKIHVNDDDGFGDLLSRPASRAGSRAGSRSNSADRKGSVASLRKAQQRRMKAAKKMIDSAVPPNLGKYEMPSWASIAQLAISLGVIVACFLPAVLWFRGVVAMSSNVHWLIIPFVAALGWLGFGLTLCGITVAGRWLLLSDVKPGRYTLGKKFYLRWWTVQRLLTATRALFLDALSGSRIPWLVYKALGAKLAWNVDLSSLDIADPWMVSIGEGSSLASMARLNTSQVFGNSLNIRKIDIGRHCSLAFHSMLDLGCKMEDGSSLTAYSWAQPFCKLKEDTIYQGSPAKQCVGEPNKRPDHVAHFGVEAVVVRLSGILVTMAIPALAGMASFWVSANAFALIFGSEHLPASMTSAAAAAAMIASWCPTLTPMLLVVSPGMSYQTFDALMAVIGGTRASILLFTMVVSLAVVAFALIYCTLTWALRRLLLSNASESYPSFGLSDNLRYVARFAMDLSYANFFWMAHATFFYTWWLRLNGGRIGKSSMVGYVSIPDPENISIGTQTFIGGRCRFETTVPCEDKKGRPAYRVQRVEIGDNALLGLYSTCTNEGVKDGVIVGATATSPSLEQQEAGAAYFGNPTIKIRPPQAEEALATKPSLSSFLKSRIETLLLVALLLPSVFLAPLPAQLLFLRLAGPDPGILRLLLVLPISVVGVIFSLVFSYNFWKKFLIGRLHKTRPIEVSNSYVARTQLFGRILFYLHRFMEFFRGSEAACSLYRLIGADIGKHVFLENTGCMTEPDLITIGDHSVVGAGVFLWSHFFINHCNTWDEIIVGSEAQIGPMSLVSAGVTIGDTALLTPCSTVMASTRVGKGKGLSGSPAHVNNEAVLRYGLSIISGTSIF